MSQYWGWVRERTSLRDVGEYVEISTPYLDRHNDRLQIYARRDGEGWILTDDAAIIRDLESSGCELDSPRRRDILATTLNGFGVRQEGAALTVRASAVDFPRKKHDLIQAMLAVNDLFYLARSTVASLFVEDVGRWMLEAGVRFTPSVTFVGRSSYNHHFHYVIPASSHEPERVVQAIARPNKDSAQSLAFAWIDTKDTRPTESVALAMLNDEDGTPPSGVADALGGYGIEAVLWSDRESVKDRLAA